MKTYSATEIISVLKPGQKAKAVNRHNFVIERSCAGIKDVSFGGLDDPEYVTLSPIFFSTKWQILPRYVSFEEALKAYKEGKTIRVEWSHDEDPNDWEMFKDFPHNSQVSFYQIIHGRWSIVEDDTEREDDNAING
ncbi:hypothetical protein [Effusibacillus dendaii]|nr:hypothetical protein [Effusibacillus dendaii]